MSQFFLFRGCNYIYALYCYFIISFVFIRKNII